MISLRCRTSPAARRVAGPVCAIIAAAPTLDHRIARTTIHSCDLVRTKLSSGPAKGSAKVACPCRNGCSNCCAGARTGMSACSSRPRATAVWALSPSTKPMCRTTLELRASAAVLSTLRPSIRAGWSVASATRSAGATLGPTGESFPRIVNQRYLKKRVNPISVQLRHPTRPWFGASWMVFPPVVALAKDWAADSTRFCECEDGPSRSIYWFRKNVHQANSGQWILQLRTLRPGRYAPEGINWTPKRITPLMWGIKSELRINANKTSPSASRDEK